MADEFKYFLAWIRQIGGRPDLVQGGGGNFSFKVNDRQMAIKASGFRFSEITEENGLSLVDYPAILEFLIAKPEISEEESVNLIMSQVLPAAAGNKIRPSMEVGFHVFLSRYVVHTHSVYANILACSEGGENLVKKKLAGLGESVLWLPYFRPGWALAVGLKKATDDFVRDRGFLPKAIFLQNHGLILAGDDWRQLAALHDQIEKILKEGLDDYFPVIKIIEKNGVDNIFVGVTSYLSDFIEENPEILANFHQNIIFPDQAVFCQDFGGKIFWDKDSGHFLYRTGGREALAIEETLTSWVFILNGIKSRDCQPQFLTSVAVDSLTGMESEKYRQQLMAGKKYD